MLTKCSENTDPLAENDARLEAVAEAVFAALAERAAMPSYADWRARVCYGYGFADAGLVIVRGAINPRIGWIYWFGRGFCPRPTDLRCIALLAWTFGLDWLGMDFEDSERPTVSARIAGAVGMQRLSPTLYGLRLDLPVDRDGD